LPCLYDFGIIYKDYKDTEFQRITRIVYCIDYQEYIIIYNEPLKKMEKFVYNLKRSGINKDDIDVILNEGSIQKYKKGDVFSHVGRRWDKMGILFNGLLGGWYIDDNAEKRYGHFYLYPENDVVVDYESYVTDVKTTLTIEALSDCEILVYDREKIIELKLKFPNLFNAEKNLAEEKYLQTQKLLNMFQTCNGVDRIRYLQKYAPDLFKKIPYTYIASFLGLHRNGFANALKRL